MKDPGNEKTERDHQLFPERKEKKAGKEEKEEKPVFHAYRKVKCEQSVVKLFEKSPLLKLLTKALKSAGCPIDYGRHISCEFCGPKVTGGFDTETNQIIVCCNNYGDLQPTIAHELIHMYDFCRTEFDVDNLEHRACTEIRAANLMHCSFLGAMVEGQASPFNFKQAHQDCVKERAFNSLSTADPTLNKAQIVDTIEKVFDRCYNDLEPLGRRLRRNSNDVNRAYRERFYYGYN